MTTEKPSSPTPEPAEATAPASKLPPYEPPCIVKKRAVSRATLFSGGGGPSSAPNLVANGG